MVNPANFINFNSFFLLMNVYEEFVDLSYEPSAKDLVCVFQVSPCNRKSAGSIAAESSIGTWTELTTLSERMKEKLMARVFKIGKDTVSIAYHPELFEKNNMPQILSSVAGNVFGMKHLKKLRLIDLVFPRGIARSFKGPAFGIDGIRKITKVKDRPLVGTIVKPKIGLSPAEHARVAYEAWVGGCDIVKDDENLSNQSFNSFQKRVELTLKAKRKAEKETGEVKIYMPNVTAETNEMLRRAREVKRRAGEYVMVDVLTSGFSAVQTLRDACTGRVLHAHRAMHAAITRSNEFGVDMHVLARIFRTIGVDQLHVGTGVGKMAEDKKAVIKNIKALTDSYHGIKQVMPVASGGLHPGMVPDIIKLFGKNVVIQAGGGIHGHPKGTLAGAKAMRAAVDAVSEGHVLPYAAARTPELKEALAKWQ